MPRNLNIGPIWSHERYICIKEITYSKRQSGFGRGRDAHLAKISPAFLRVKPSHSRAAILSSFSGRSTCVLIDKSTLRIRTDAVVSEEGEDATELMLPWYDEGPRDYQVSSCVNVGFRNLLTKKSCTDLSLPIRWATQEDLFFFKCSCLFGIKDKG